MAGLIEGLATFAQPWSDLYPGSTALSATVAFLHLGGLLVAGGFALAFDRASLRVVRGVVPDRSGFLRELTAIHLPVVAALAVVIMSGVALMMADVEVFLPSTVFWLKMGGFVLLLVNGLAIQAAGRRLQRDAMDARGWTRAAGRDSGARRCEAPVCGSPFSFSACFSPLRRKECSRHESASKRPGRLRRLRACASPRS